MKDDARIKPYERSSFFADGRSARPPVEGTIARGQLRESEVFYRGLDADGTFTRGMPVPVTAELLERGRERYEIFCSPCHSRVGDGNGMIVQRGYKQPNSYHIERLRQIENGYFYDVISNGFGQMSSYAGQVKPHDRWAIVAWIRVLQLAQHSNESAIPVDLRQRIQSGEVVDVRPPSGAAAEQGHDEHH
jgi:mono/diheme cytochrome c family protein